MAAGLAVVMLRGHLVRLIKRLNVTESYLIGFAALLLLIDSFLAIAVHLHQIMLIEVLLIHHFVRKRLGPELAAMHLLGLSNYGHCYIFSRVLGVMG